MRKILTIIAGLVCIAVAGIMAGLVCIAVAGIMAVATQPSASHGDEPVFSNPDADGSYYLCVPGNGGQVVMAGDEQSMKYYFEGGGYLWDGERPCYWWTIETPDTDEPVVTENEGEIGTGIVEDADPSVPTEEEIANGDVDSEVHEFPEDYNPDDDTNGDGVIDYEWEPAPGLSCE